MKEKVPKNINVHCDPGCDKSNELSEPSLNELLCNLIAEWETEECFFGNSIDSSYDRGVGQTYKRCASELRKAIGA